MIWTQQQEVALFFQADMIILTIMSEIEGMDWDVNDLNVYFLSISCKVFEYWQNDPERISRNHTYYPDRTNKTDWTITNYRGILRFSNSGLLSIIQTTYYSVCRRRPHLLINTQALSPVYLHLGLWFFHILLSVVIKMSNIPRERHLF